MRPLIIVWLLVITAISIAPLSAKIFLHTVGQWHDYGHLFVFFTTEMLVLFNAPRVSMRVFRTSLILCFCAVLELMQAIGYHNRFEWHDLWVDYLAIFCSWAAILVFRPLLRLC